jgi:hypothetical protein
MSRLCSKFYRGAREIISGIWLVFHFLFFAAIIYPQIEEAERLKEIEG